MPITAATSGRDWTDSKARDLERDTDGVTSISRKPLISQIYEVKECVSFFFFLNLADTKQDL